MAFTTRAGTMNECKLKNKDHGAAMSIPDAVSATMKCLEFIAEVVSGKMGEIRI